MRLYAFRTMVGRGVLWFQIRRAFGSKALPYVFLFSFGVAAVCYLQTCLKFWGHDISEVPSAAVAWAGNSRSMETNAFLYFLNYLMLPLAAAIFGDSFCADVRSGLAANGAVRSSVREYAVSGAVAAFLAAFCAMATALLASQLLAHLAFPPASSPDAYQSAGFFTAVFDSLDHLSVGLFGRLRVSSRSLCNVIFAMQASLWAAVGSAAAYAISLFSNKSRLLAIGIPALTFSVANMVLPQELAPLVLMEAILFDGGVGEYSLAVFVLEPLAAPLLSVLAVVAVVSLRRDVLL